MGRPQVFSTLSHIRNRGNNTTLDRPIDIVKTQNEYFQEHIRRASHVPTGRSPPGNLDDLAVKPRGAGSKTANNPQPRTVVRAGKITSTMVEPPVEVTEFVRNGMKTTFNLSNPKYGLKNYTVRTSKMDDSRIDSHAINKLDKADHYTDLAAAKTKNFPPAKYNIVRDWAGDPMFPHS